MIDIGKIQKKVMLAAALLLAGCAVGPTYERPVVEAPTDWNAGQADARWPAPDWWTAFQDPVLDRLVTEALANNHDIKAAVERVAEARALAQVAGAALYPSLSADAQAGRQKNSSSNPNARTSKPFNSYQAGLTASYEIDLFGGNRDQALATAAALKGSEFDRETIALGVTATVTATYFQFSALDARLETARLNLAAARSTLDLVRAQSNEGMATALQVAQQESQVASLEAALPTLLTQRRQTLNALALLLGRVPENFDTTPTALVRIVAPMPPAGLPSALLQRRPDLVRAEAALEAANANVRAATAALFPRIDLTAQGGFNSLALHQLFDSGSVIYSLAAGITAPIFDGGRLRGELAYTQARYRELAQNYQQAVIAAFGDAENALTAQANTQMALDARQQAVVHAERAYRFAELQYREGMIDYLTVLIAERSRIAARDAEVQAQLERLGAAVSVYQALGGGWRMPTSTATTLEP